MKKAKLIFGLVLGLISLAIVSVPIANFLEVNPVSVGLSLAAVPFTIKLAVRLCLGFTPTQSKFAFMAVQKENWVDYILANLFKDNAFLNYCYNESESVLNGTVVHIPQAGAKPNVVKNRSLLPGVAVQRADTDITYALDWYTTDPTVITNAESKEVSYDKMDSVIGEHVQTLTETIAEEILYKWAPTTVATITRTTGATADGVALAPGATGTRKPLMLADLRKAKTTMNKAGVLKGDRFALIPEDMATQLMSDPAMTANMLEQLMNIKEGTIGRLEGFTIFTRANAAIYDNSGTPVPKLITAATATSDNLSVLCWQKNAVAKAMGTVDFFENKQDATFYGDVYSAGVRCGGRKRRTLAEGVHAIVQTT